MVFWFLKLEDRSGYAASKTVELMPNVRGLRVGYLFLAPTNIILKEGASQPLSLMYIVG